MIHRSAYCRSTAFHHLPVLAMVLRGFQRYPVRTKTLLPLLLAMVLRGFPRYAVRTRAVLPVLLVVLLCASPGKLNLLRGQALLSSLNTSCSNYISINGETNINTFSLDQFVPEDVICGTDGSQWILLPEKEVYLIRVPVRNFQSSNKMVYRDFLELIDVRKHPYINIFMETSQFQLLLSERTFSTPRIGISVAGNTRYYNIPCTVSDCVDGKIAVSGHKTLKLTDFKLAPPEKTLGLIKVQNELIINFEFSLPSETGIKLSKI